GTVSLNAGTQLNLSAAIVAGGAVTQTGAGAVSAAANITTTDDPISFASAVTVAANITLDTTNGGAGSGADIIFSGAVASDGTARSLSLRAGTGTITAAGAVGSSPNNLNLLTVVSAGVADFQNIVRANNIALTAGLTHFRNNITALTDDVSI